MRIGFLSTRLAGTDGVSLEVEKWAGVLRHLGHEVFFCAGELDGYASEGALIPKLHFQHEQILSINREAFESPDFTPAAVMKRIRSVADELKTQLQHFIIGQKLDMLIVQNAFAIPMNLPFGLALTEIIEDSGIRTIAHNHDFFWERERYQSGRLVEFLDMYFPPDLPSIRHVTINSIAQRWLKARRGIDSVIVPNVHDFDTPPEPPGAFAADIRSAIRLPEGAPLILQPTRVIRRKGIELALMLVKSLELDHPSLYITHSATDEGGAYFNWLQSEAEKLGVELRKVDDMITQRRTVSSGKKFYALWDFYPHADLVTYPSLYEGFGNALLEAVYYRKTIVVNTYPVYQADIRPLGFDFIELNGFVSDEAVQKTREALAYPDRARAIAEKNYEIARDNYSLAVLERKLREILASF